MKFIFWGSVAVALLLRFFAVLDFEFKSDQYMVFAAMREWQWPWNIVHGMRSSAGVDNPPGFYQLLMLLRWGEYTPGAWAAVFGVISAATVFLPLIFRKQLGYKYACGGVLLVAISPLLIFMAGNVWAQMLLAPLGLLWFYLLLRYRRAPEKGEIFFAAAFTVAMLAASVHMSGFFLLPVLLCFYRWRRFDWRTFGVIILAGAAFFGRYAIYCLRNLPTDMPPRAPGGAAKFLNSLWQLPGGNFGFNSFGSSFPEVIGEFMPLPAAWLLLLAPGVLLTAAVFKAIYDAARDWHHTPDFVRLALAAAGGFALLLLALSALPIWYYYWLPVAMPLFFVAIYGFYSFPKTWRKIGAYCCTASSLLLAAFMLLYIYQNGGHTFDYGISYRTHCRIAEEIARLNMVKPVNLFIRAADGDAANKLEKETAIYFFGKFFNPAGEKKLLTISSENKKYKFNLQ